MEKYSTGSHKTERSGHPADVPHAPAPVCRVDDPALWQGGAECCYVSVRYPDGKLAFRVDVGRGIVEIAQRGRVHYFDLRVVGGLMFT